MSIGFAILLYRLFISNLNKTVFTSLVFILLYEAGTVVGIASGRLISGFNQALESRYMTSSLVIWALFIVMFAFGMKSYFEKRPNAILMFCVIPLLLLPYQSKTLDKNVNHRFQMLGAALAVEMNIKDEKQTGHIWPWVDSLFDMAGPAHKWDASILGHWVFKGLNEKVGQSFVVDASNNNELCSVTLSAAEMVQGEKKAYKITGSQTPREGQDLSERLAIVSNENRVIGFMISENLVPRIGDKPKIDVPVLGYATQILEHDRIKLYSDNGYCNLSSAIN